MEKFKLAIGLHNHQPVGNFDFVFEDSHKKAYKPFFDLLEQYPHIQLSLHQSGILWRWQEQHHPEYLNKIEKMVATGQLEIMTGGFYEPILVSIPEDDISGQISLLDTYIQSKLHTTPQGAWLTERIWEPHLPKILNKAGVRFIPVDDTHFIYAGFEHSQLKGPFVTEYEGYPLTILPISKRMRYLLPFGTVEEVIDELKLLAAENPGGMVIYADDGEKFGSWPNTYKHCYEDGWLKQLFDAVTENSNWLEVVPLSRAAKAKPEGRAYLPSASYAEMLHWSLPPKAFLEYEGFENFLKENKVEAQYQRFVRGGHWRGFLTKYEEVNLMHKKMMYLSKKLSELKKEHQNSAAFVEAREALYAGQCNCPYWHGVFGGLYLPHIRQAIYEHLIKAERTIRSISKPTENINIIDYDADGYEEIIFTNDFYSATFKPHNGGTLVDLSLLSKNFSVTDTLTRRKEGYHLKLTEPVEDESKSTTKSIHDQVLVKEEGLAEHLFDDWYLKRCFIDHIFTTDVDFEEFKSNTFGEYGDFVLEPYAFRSKNKNTIDLAREGKLWKPDGIIPFTIEKQFTFDDNSALIDITYKLSTNIDSEVEINFGIENNFNFQAGHAIDRFIQIDSQRYKESYLDSKASYCKVHTITLFDQYRDIAVSLHSETESNIWHLPIFTVSLSEGGFEKVYQGTTIVNQFRLKVAKKPIELKFTLMLDSEETVKDYLKSGILQHHRS